jgi:hypothetical protein
VVSGALACQHNAGSRLAAGPLDKIAACVESSFSQKSAAVVPFVIWGDGKLAVIRRNYGGMRRGG